MLRARSVFIWFVGPKIVETAQRQSAELLRKARTLLGLAQPGIKIKADSTLAVELANGSRIVSLPGKEATIRGFSDVSLLAIDEAARVPEDVRLPDGDEAPAHALLDLHLHLPGLGRGRQDAAVERDAAARPEVRVVVADPAGDQRVVGVAGLVARLSPIALQFPRDR